MRNRFYKKLTTTASMLVASIMAAASVLFGSTALLAQPLVEPEQASVFQVHAKLGFFNHDSVVDMNSPMEFTEQQQIQMGPSKGLDLSSDFKLNNKQEKDDKNQSALVKQEEKIPEGADAQEFAIKKEFGDPSVPVPVKGTDTAPTPYKAMLKAIEMGRDDLALQYAEQWMGYMKSLERVTKKAASMSQIAGLKADQLEVAMNSQEVGDIDPAGLQRYLERQKQRESQSSNIDTTQLNTRDKEVIDALFGEGDTGNDKSALILNDPYAALVDKNIDSTSRRAMIRSQLANKLPYDPKGLIKILYFLKTSDAADLMIGREITTALSSESLTVPVSVVPLSVEPIKTTSNSEFMSITGLPANLRDGVALSRSLNVSNTPALVFSTSNSNKIFIKTGQVDSVFIEEVCRIIGGK